MVYKKTPELDIFFQIDEKGEGGLALSFLIYKVWFTISLQGITIMAVIYFLFTFKNSALINEFNLVMVNLF